jgi:processive 1,2-diacylglycerol beta-glucosyltransferase
MDKVCPECGQRYKWYESECPDCQVTLVDAPDEQEQLKELKLTVVFTTSEPGLVPLASLALEQRGIEFTTRLRGSDSMSAGGRAYRGEGSNEPVEILVREEDAATAADLLKDLEDNQSPSGVAPAPVSTPVPAAPPPPAPDADVSLVDLATNQPVGRITDADLEWLGGQLEKESVDDRDYYFNRATLDMLEGAGAAPALMAVLRGALGARDDMELRWTR